jgi:hypothetical protein
LSSEEQYLEIVTPFFVLPQIKRFYYFFKLNKPICDEPFNISIPIKPHISSEIHNVKFTADIHYHGIGLSGSKVSHINQDLGILTPNEIRILEFRMHKAHISGNAFLTNIRITTGEQQIPVYEEQHRRPDAFTSVTGYHFYVLSPEEVAERYRTRLIQLATIVIASLTLLIVTITLIVTSCSP